VICPGWPLRITKAPRNKVEGGCRGVAKVQLLVDGKVVGTDAKAGYSFDLGLTYRR
jgi:hypothetical protein